MQLKQLILQTSSLKELSSFYSTLMELPVDTASKREIEIKIGSTELIFQQTVAGNPFYHLAITIPSNKIKEAWNWLSSRVKLVWIEEYKSDIADFVNWNAKSLYFFDPAGNILELIARFDLNNEMDEPFSSRQLLSVSEIGLVFKEDELNKKVENLLQQYHLSYFDKQPPLPQFKVAGDNEGLFVIVPENRNWFPTDKISGIFPMEILFENKGTKYLLKF
jgi:hypothetical protein